MEKFPYRVTICYREPTYASRHRSKVYSGSFDLLAGSLEEATSRALREFDRLTRLSSVGWIREIESVEARCLPGGPVVGMPL